MTCKSVQEKLSMYLDGDLPLHEVSSIKDHIENCKECHELYEDMKLMKEVLEDMPQLDLPESFEAELHDKLVEVAAELKDKKDMETESSQAVEEERKVIRIPLPNMKDFKKHAKPLTAVAATVLIAFLAYGAGNVMDYMPSNMNEAAYTEDSYDTMEAASEEYFDGAAEPEMAFNETANDTAISARGAGEPAVFGKALNSMADGVEMKEAPAEAFSVTEESAPQQSQEPVDAAEESRMLIFTANTYLDIVNYDETYEKIVSMVKSMGGYVGDASTSYKYYDESNPENSLKYGQLTIRVPQSNFMGTVDSLEQFGVQKSLNIWSQDITSQYRDIANEVANLEIREAKLREIMERAEEIEDVINVERELSRVRGEINGYMGTLKNWDRLVSLSTIHIELNEVETLEPKIKPIDKTLLQKARDGFVNSINQLKFLGESIFIGGVAFFPKLIVWVILFFIGYKIVKWILRRFKK